MTVRVPRELCLSDPADLAPRAGLEMVTDSDPGYTRRRCGKGFSYLDAERRRVATPERDRLVALAVPPAWSDVWFCPSAQGYLQATGRDDACRKQYRYHEDFRALRDQQKFDRMTHFPRALRILRSAVASELESPAGTKTHAVAAALRLLDAGLVRVGNEQSAEDGHYGATTLHRDHLDTVRGEDTDGYVTLQYVAKGGAERTVVLEDDVLSEVLVGLAEGDEDRLFWFQCADTGETRQVTAADVNTTIVELVGPAFSAKDFRTWGGSRRALEARVQGADEVEAVDAAAEALGNTRAVARASYVHPTVLTAEPRQLDDVWRRSRDSTALTRGDSALAKLLGSSASLVPRG